MLQARKHTRICRCYVPLRRHVCSPFQHGTKQNLTHADVTRDLVCVCVCVCADIRCSGEVICSDAVCQPEDLHDQPACKEAEARRAGTKFFACSDCCMHAARAASSNRVFGLHTEFLLWM